MNVDQTAGQAATVVLGSYLASHAAQDPQLRDILATLGAAMGMSTVPWAGATPPPVAPLAAPPSSEVAEAMAAALRQDRLAAAAKAQLLLQPQQQAARQKSNSRSPTPKGPGGTGKGKSTGGKGLSQPSGPPGVEGLAQLQATLGLSGEGLPIPDADGDI